MTRCGAVLLAFVCAGPSMAAPFVAYVGGVPVHSGSPSARVMVRDLGAEGKAIDVSVGLFSARAPSWSRDGLLAFEAMEGPSSDIYMCRPDGSARVNVTNTPDEWESAPAFLGDGRIVCLTGPDRTAVVLVDLATGQQRRLPEPQRFHGAPATAPGGEAVAVFASDRLAGPGDLVVVPIDGGPARALTAEKALYSAPCFSPDGRAIFACFDGTEIGGVTRGLARFPLDGSPPSLLAEQGYPLSALSVSADGGRVAYTTSRSYHDTWVSLANTDGSGATRLEVTGFHIIAWPNFSPDGKWLAFEGVYAATYTVHAVDLASGAVIRITPQGDTGVHPVFSR